MQLLEAALQPLTLDDLKEHYNDGKCLVLEGATDKFKDIVSLSDIERRLNDGCNASTFPQVIKQGERSANTDSRCTWSPASLKKSAFIDDIKAGYSFMMPNSSQVSRGLSRLCDDIEACFSEEPVQADVHLYVSTSAQGNSYNAHRDLPQHKILIQALGDVDWQIFEAKKEIPDNLRAVNQEQQDEYLRVASEFTLSQGDLLYMPPGVFHRVVGVSGPRVSVSIPFYNMPGATAMDRTYIPFTKIFNHDD